MGPVAGVGPASNPRRTERYADYRTVPARPRPPDFLVAIRCRGPPTPGPRPLQGERGPPRLQGRRGLETNRDQRTRPPDRCVLRPSPDPSTQSRPGTSGNPRGRPPQRAPTDLL